MLAYRGQSRIPFLRPHRAARCLQICHYPARTSVEMAIPRETLPRLRKIHRVTSRRTACLLLHPSHSPSLIFFCARHIHSQVDGPDASHHISNPAPVTVSMHTHVSWYQSTHMSATACLTHMSVGTSIAQILAGASLAAELTQHLCLIIGDSKVSHPITDGKDISGSAELIEKM